MASDNDTQQQGRNTRPGAGQGPRDTSTDAGKPQDLQPPPTHSGAAQGTAAGSAMKQTAKTPQETGSADGPGERR